MKNDKKVNQKSENEKNKKKKIINIRKSVSAIGLSALILFGIGKSITDVKDSVNTPEPSPSITNGVDGSESPSVTYNPNENTYETESPTPTESDEPIVSEEPTTSPSESEEPIVSEEPTVTPSENPTSSNKPNNTESLAPVESWKPGDSIEIWYPEVTPSESQGPTDSQEPVETPEHKHSWSEWMIIKNPSCTEDGLKRKTCSCGEVEERTIKATGHELTEKVTKKPTCTENGIKTISCIKGDYTKTESIPALGHKYGKTVWGNWKVVTENGETFEKRTGTQICENDKSHVNIVTETRPYTPPVIEEPEHTHNWSNWMVIENPSCTIDGKERRTCSCGEVEERTIPATGHDLTESITKQPTCTEAGEKTISCAKGDYTITESIPALGHVEVVIPGKAATCTETGLTEGIKCSRCGEIIKAQEVIPALGHDFETEFTIDKEATCAEDGSKSKHCTRCDARTEVTVIPKGAHTWGEWIVTKEANCTEAGEKTRTCSVCLNTETDSIPAKGHTEKPGSRNTYYTNDSNSYCHQDYYECADCGKQIFIGNPVEHNFTDFDPGTGDTKCSSCGTAMDQIIEAEEAAINAVNLEASLLLEDIINGKSTLTIDDVIQMQEAKIASIVANADLQLNALIQHENSMTLARTK